MTSIAGFSDGRNRSTEAPFWRQNLVLEMIANNPPLEETLAGLVLLMESQFEGMSYYVVVLDGDGQHLHHIAERYDAGISLLITDVVLPGINGRALAERLVSRRPGTKVLYISGYTDDDVVRNGVLHSDFAFLTKPFSQEALALKVREILDAPA